MSLQVCEIFYSIQGESSSAGYPCIFIRLSGCNLNCSYCDTTYAYNPGQEYLVDQIIKSIDCYPCRLVAITGGEPLLQEQTPQLVSELIQAGYSVLLETNGTIEVGALDIRCVKIVDIKCPASGEVQSFNPAVLGGLSRKDELKFVISDRCDYEFARDFLQRLGSITIGAIHFSPVMSRIPVSELAAWILADGLSVRCAPQLHRFIWPDITRGV
jgi:7-carboxy-7-deazaguanine synthase